MIDLSTLTRDELRSLLSTAKNEWKNYIDCRDEVERCEKRMEKEKEENDANRQLKGNGCLIMGIIVICVIIILVFAAYKNNYGGYFWIAAFLSVPVCLFFYDRNKADHYIKVVQDKIEEYEAQLSELQKKEEKAVKELNDILLIPDDYCYEYALSKMLRYIDNGRAHNWKEVTAMYEQHLYEETMKENARITAEEAKKQTEIGRQTRNAARAAAAGALWSAVRR